MSVSMTVDTAIQAPPTVFVVDDDPHLRQSLKMLINAAGFATEVYESAEAFLDAHPSPPNHPSCLLLDVRIRGMSGIGLQAKLAAEGFSTPIIIISGAATISMAVQAIKAGAMDFLEKPFHREVLLDRVQRALDQDAETHWKLSRQADMSSLLRTLSPREHEVMLLLVEGETTKGIAARLQIGFKTVAKHRMRVLNKMGVDTVIELSHLIAASNGLDRSRPQLPR
jgi:FixJ family two-component response regulator